jgi:CDP-diacylglycerol--glycerol-3-phosphate 3-phosphatidyltransferase
MGLTLANKVTIGRIFIVPLFIATVLYYSGERDYLRFVSLGLFLVAVISDVIDGYIARRFYQKTKAGAVLDPLADKLLLVSAFTCLYIVGKDFPVFHFPVWLVVTVISRDVILLLGALIIQLTTGQLNIEASISGKAAAFFQTICVLGMFLQWPWSEVLWPVTVVITIISGLLYIRDGIKVINDSGSQIRS